MTVISNHFLFQVIVYNWYERRLSLANVIFFNKPRHLEEARCTITLDNALTVSVSEQQSFSELSKNSHFMRIVYGAGKWATSGGIAKIRAGVNRGNGFAGLFDGVADLHARIRHGRGINAPRIYLQFTRA